MPTYGSVILVAIILLPLFTSVFISIYLFKKGRRGRRSPLTGNLLRGAGESLRKEIERISEKIDDTFFNMVFLFAPPLAMLLLMSYVGNNVFVWQLILLFGLYCILLVRANRHLYSLLKQRTNLYLGLDAELAVGQELNHLMRHGCHVYHDFPAEGFNIDHVVVGPAGVFAVETKGRAKPDKGRGNIDAKVFYDGETLKFPDWYERKPLDQAKRQSVWLSKWLTSAVGEQVKVFPVLALPGWFVERTKVGGVLVINGKSPFILAKPKGHGCFDEKVIQQISHQLEQRCRDVAPVGYCKAKNKAA